MQSTQLTYTDYLATDYWRAVSQAVRQRAGFRCQICNSPHDLQAHHRSYEHRGREMEYLDDLTCLCRRCHGIFHGTLTPPGMANGAKATAPVSEPEELILITGENCQRLRCNKEPWHWMLREGINPRKSGWAVRAIGRRVPRRWMRCE